MDALAVPVTPDLQAVYAGYRREQDQLVGAHLRAPVPVDWAAEAGRPLPDPPSRTTAHADPVHMELFEFAPTVADRLFGRGGRKLARIKARLAEAERRDEDAFVAAAEAYELEREAVARRRRLAERVLAGDPTAYAEAFEAASTMREGVEVREVDLHVSAGDNGGVSVHVVVVPSQSGVPGRWVDEDARGGLSVRYLSEGEKAALYEDYLCSLVLRGAREALAVLPIDVVRVSAVARVVNPATGHEDDVVLVRADVNREALSGLNLDRVDPSDALSTFPHHMDVPPLAPRPGISTSLPERPDALLDAAARVVVHNQKGSASLLQEVLGVGYSRASRLIDQLEDVGIVGPFVGYELRPVLMDGPQLEAFLSR